MYVQFSSGLFFSCNSLLVKLALRTPIMCWGLRMVGEIEYEATEYVS